MVVLVLVLQVPEDEMSGEMLSKVPIQSGKVGYGEGARGVLIVEVTVVILLVGVVVEVLPSDGLVRMTGLVGVRSGLADDGAGG